MYTVQRYYITHVDSSEASGTRHWRYAQAKVLTPAKSLTEEADRYHDPVYMYVLWLEGQMVLTDWLFLWLPDLACLVRLYSEFRMDSAR